MKLVLDGSGIGMKVVLDESGIGMKVVLDELVFYLFPLIGSFSRSNNSTRTELYRLERTLSNVIPRNPTRPDGSDRPTQPNNKTRSMNHAGDTHPMKMGVSSRRVSLKLNLPTANNLRTNAGDN